MFGYTGHCFPEDVIYVNVTELGLETGEEEGCLVVGGVMCHGNW